MRAWLRSSTGVAMSGKMCPSPTVDVSLNGPSSEAQNGSTYPLSIRQVLPPCTCCIYTDNWLVLLKALATKEIGCPNSKEDLAEMCRELIAETESHPPSPDCPVDPGFFLSFWHYPMAYAYSYVLRHELSNMIYAP